MQSLARNMSQLLPDRSHSSAMTLIGGLALLSWGESDAN